MTPTRVPTASELLIHPVVVQSLEDAWRDSSPEESLQRHEEGGWILLEVSSGRITAFRAPVGGMADIDLCLPTMLPGTIVVATFHTHPNPTNEGWEPGPSPEDTESAWLLGVPCLIRADNGVYSTGPDSRRGGLTGGPGFPP